MVSVGKLRSSSSSSDDDTDESDERASRPADVLHGVLHISHLYNEGELACMHFKHCHFFSTADAFKASSSAWHSLHLVPSEFLYVHTEQIQRPSGVLRASSGMAVSQAWHLSVPIMFTNVQVEQVQVVPSAGTTRGFVAPHILQVVRNWLLHLYVQAGQCQQFSCTSADGREAKRKN